MKNLKLAEQFSKNIFPMILDMWKDIDEKISVAGSEKEYDQYCKASYEMYQQSIKTAKIVEPLEWKSTVEIDGKCFMALALFYLEIAYDWDSRYINEVIKEEFAHYDEASKLGHRPSFIIRFFVDANNIVNMEPSTLTLVYGKGKKGKNFKKQIVRDIGKIVNAENRSKDESEWDKNIKKDLKKLT